MMFLAYFAAATAVSLSAAALVYWLNQRAIKRIKSKALDREYERLCNDPRYQVR